MPTTRPPRAARPTHRHAGHLDARAIVGHIGRARRRPCPTRMLTFPTSPAPAVARSHTRRLAAAALVFAALCARPLAAQATMPPAPPMRPVHNDSAIDTSASGASASVPVPSAPASGSLHAGGAMPVVLPVIPAAAMRAYRVPALALVYPTAEASTPATVPADRPAGVFRFAGGEADDPLDPQSFSVAVDGHARTALFQLAGSQTWGPLAAPNENGGVMASGPHQVVARICSNRGACVAAVSTVTAISVITSATSPTTSAAVAAAVPNAVVPRTTLPSSQIGRAP
jgi:hypothetical protein